MCLHMNSDSDHEGRMIKGIIVHRKGNELVIHAMDCKFFDKIEVGSPECKQCKDFDGTGSITFKGDKAKSYFVLCDKLMRVGRKYDQENE